MLKIVLIGSFYNVVLPGSNGGDFIKGGIIKSKAKDAPISEIASIILMERVLGLTMSVFIGFISTLVLSPHILELIKTEVSFAKWIYISFAFVSVILIALRFLIRNNNKNKSSILGKIIKLMNTIIGVPFGTLIILLVSSMLKYLTELLSIYCVTYSLGLDVSFSFICFIVPMIFLVVFLPISLGGLGVREGAFVYFFSKLGIGTSLAISASFMIYFYNVLVFLSGGIIQFNSKSKSTPQNT